MDSAKAQLADKLKSANNVLVTVSRDPSVDQLAACLGLTLLLNKLNKHAAAVFSGQVPSTIEFLKPDETLEKTTDSLRDFIIALDKSKADKLRYKVEDNVVRIFITPYRTSISEKDFDFSQGDFNVEVVVALGVQRQEDLDEAITAHGRILHDATVASLNIAADGGLGSIAWHDPQASSLSELVTELAQTLGDKLIDNQIATALLTGIVSETNRFSNDKTSSQTMSASAALMAAGANQQLVATELQKPAEPPKTDDKPDDQTGGTPPNPDDDTPKSDNGTLEIKHEAGDQDAADNSAPAGSSPADTDQNKPGLDLPTPQTEPADDAPAPAPTLSGSDSLSPGPKRVTEPPSLGGTLTANSQVPSLDPVTDPLSMPKQEEAPLLTRDAASAAPLAPTPSDETAAPITDITQPKIPTPDLTPPPPTWTPPPSPSPLPPASEPATGNKTLTELEQAVGSEHVAETTEAGVDAARDEVSRALNSSVETAPQAIQALNAQPFGDSLHGMAATTPGASAAASPSLPPAPPQTPSAPSAGLPTFDPTPTPLTAADATASPPPVPPPIPFQFGSPRHAAAGSVVP